MKQRQILWLLVLGLTLTLLPARGWAQAEKVTQSADITSDTMSFNWNTNAFEFAGNAKVVMVGPYQATITGPKMNVELTKDNRVKQMLARGPVKFDLISPPDKDGVRNHIVATADDSAEYSEVTQKIVLRGNAQTTIISLPETADSRRVYFTGDVMEADLGTGTMTVTKAHMQASTPIKQPPPATPKPATAPAATP